MELFVFGPLWIVFAIIAFFVGNKKSGGGCLWAFLALLFGPFALLFVLIAPYKK
ncbi:hypothetical protein KQI52_06705 [bacterium]|nr:hypothetical protein [bacterium]